MLLRVSHRVDNPGKGSYTRVYAIALLKVLPSYPRLAHLLGASQIN
jgi:hypothetical protein